MRSVELPGTAPQLTTTIAGQSLGISSFGIVMRRTRIDDVDGLRGSPQRTSGAMDDCW